MRKVRTNRMYSNRAEVSLPEGIELKVLARTGSAASAHALPSLAVGGWTSSEGGMAQVARCTLEGVQGGMQLQASVSGGLGIESAVAEIELEGGAPDCIVFDPLDTVENGGQLTVHAWLEDAQGNPANEDAARAYRWQLAAGD